MKSKNLSAIVITAACCLGQHGRCAADRPCLPARKVSTVGSLRISAMFMSGSLEVMIIDSPFTATGAP
jgi:hypothetical protein